MTMCISLSVRVMYSWQLVQSLAPVVCNHMASDPSHHLLSSPVLSVVVYKLTLGVHQVHDDAVVHLHVGKWWRPAA